MKKYLLFPALLVLSFSANSQKITPKMSAVAKIVRRVVMCEGSFLIADYYWARLVHVLNELSETLKPFRPGHWLVCVEN